jgi:hypothetical protein
MTRDGVICSSGRFGYFSNVLLVKYTDLKS